ncbi:hypothetical protein LLS1_18500 [Leifsonia sp. LS1]|uniref:hypothetical protein n=1 Tax=Leifsonia sp. LS1 TaxID=2828483 RepID=UPI001CFCE1DC|nr:hypothetical protein [Leifsonia sp. LS1]GIT80181.1 hypothetical protein LLS1_18500 [Leifsonia sp. LS1]
MIDGERLVYELLQAAAPPGTQVLPESDLDVLGELPVWMFHTDSDGQSENGPGLWSFTLDVNVFGNGIDAAKQQARLCYDAIWSWMDDPAATVIDGVGWVSEVEDMSLFSRAGTPALTGRGVSQYAGSFALALRN